MEEHSQTRRQFFNQKLKEKNLFRNPNNTEEEARNQN